MLKIGECCRARVLSHCSIGKDSFSPICPLLVYTNPLGLHSESYHSLINELDSILFYID